MKKQILLLASVIISTLAMAQDKPHFGVRGGFSSASMPENESWTPVVKLSDEPAKYTGEPEALELAKKVLGITKN